MNTRPHFSEDHLGLIINISFRLVLLGCLIFLVTTYIPNISLEIGDRFIISIVVVLIYSSSDLIMMAVKNLQSMLCKEFCKCDSR